LSWNFALFGALAGQPIKIQEEEKCLITKDFTSNSKEFFSKIVADTEWEEYPIIELKNHRESEEITVFSLQEAYVDEIDCKTNLKKNSFKDK